MFALMYIFDNIARATSWWPKLDFAFLWGEIVEAMATGGELGVSKHSAVLAMATWGELGVSKHSAVDLVGSKHSAVEAMATGGE